MSPARHSDQCLARLSREIVDKIKGRKAHTKLLSQSLENPTVAIVSQWCRKTRTLYLLSYRCRDEILWAVIMVYSSRGR